MGESVRAIHFALDMLERRRVITTAERDRYECCGLDRDADGFCVHRRHHPIFVDLSMGTSERGETP